MLTSFKYVAGHIGITLNIVLNVYITNSNTGNMSFAHVLIISYLKRQDNNKYINNKKHFKSKSIIVKCALFDFQ